MAAHAHLVGNLVGHHGGDGTHGGGAGDGRAGEGRRGREGGGGREREGGNEEAEHECEKNLEGRWRRVRHLGFRFGCFRLSCKGAEFENDGYKSMQDAPHMLPV